MNFEPKSQKAHFEVCRLCAARTTLSDLIELTFEEWRLTHSEQDIAKMLIQGHSLKEIAKVRNTSESTVRLQALSIYSKSSLNGRHQLAAFFLNHFIS